MIRLYVKSYKEQDIKALYIALNKAAEALESMSIACTRTLAYADIVSAINYVALRMNNKDGQSENE